MARILFNFISSFQIKCRRPFSLLILVLTFFTTIILAFSQTPTNNCLLDIQTTSSDNINTSCTRGNWDGFTGNKCCGSVFDGYLHALAKRANQTGNIYLKSTEQKECLNYSCGIEKLNSGQGGCSDYSVADVVNNLGNDFRKLGEDCNVLNESNMSCTACLMRWEGMRTSIKVENDVCRFAVLISLTSQRIDDDKWIQEVYKCLGERSLSLVNEGITTRKSKRIGSGEPGLYHLYSLACPPTIASCQEQFETSMCLNFLNDYTGLWILIGGLVGITIVIVAVAWILSRKSKKAKVLVKAATIGSVSEDYSCRKISVKEVYSATDNLNESNFIGQGIAGKVYKGILSNGQDVAVKHIINDGQMETFVREVTSLSHVRHPNLVALLGHCEGEEDCFLVYELCHKGNLAEWLFGKDKTLSWTQRIEIAIDCARGLWFLHTYPEGCIVHRDIKPTNILLCANFRGKLADFGLSKVIDTGLSYVSSEVRGTFGYVDPEYRKNHHVNSSGDVYSFGIVLLQLISGQRVINLDANKPMPLDKMAKMLTKGGNMIEFSDPKLDGEFPEDAFELVIKLALTCTGMKQQRPSMEQVVGKLEKVLDMSTRYESTVPQFKLCVD